jgi:hypothetical protein
MKRNERNDAWLRGCRIFCKNGVKNTPEKHWFFGILLAGAKINAYLCIMKNTKRENEKIEWKVTGEEVSKL